MTLTLYEYDALCSGWERAHEEKDGNAPLEAPTIEETERRRKRLEERGIRVLH